MEQKRKLFSQFSLKNLTAKLKEASDKIDMDSMDLCDAFDRDKIEHHEFVKSYVKLRIEYHKRMIYTERLMP